LYHYSIIKRVISVCIALSLAFTLGITASGWNSTAALADSKPDLTVPDITLSPSDPAIGDTVTITVTVKNQGTAVAAASQVVCYIDDTILATNSIVSLNVGTMATTTFTWQAQSGSHIIRAVADSSGFIPETDESNNTMTFGLTTLAPDLFVQSISWSPTKPSKGDSIVFSVTIKNQGNSKSRSTRINLYIDGNSRGYRDINSIDPANTTTTTYNWIAQSGQHNIKAVIDDTNQVKEGNETNNEYTFTFSTLPPDLIVKNITWSPENPSKNDEVTFTANITNQGTGRSDACQLAYYIDGSFKSLLGVEAMEANTSDNITFTWMALSDLHEIKVIVDFNNTVMESDETNNEKTAGFLAVRPDLFVQDITWLPLDAGVGDTVTFTATIKNKGAGRSEPFRVNCYVSGYYAGFVDILLLEADAKTTATFQWTATNGTHTVSVVADYNFQIIESDEFNNETTKSIPIIPPDIYIPSITWSPENPAIGDIVTFTTNMTNQGGGTAANFYVAYYLDNELLSFEFVSRIESGDNVSTTYTWKSQNGRHIFKAVADYDNKVNESNENNNENAVTVSPLMPDIAVGTITWSPADMPLGSKVNFAINIENQGTLSAGPSRVAYYIDGSIAVYADIDRLDAGAAVTEYLPWVVATGSHTITIVADSNDQVLELDENNNTKVVGIPLPELIVQDITWSPPEASIGDNVTFTATIKNQGSGPTQISQVTCYIDGLLLASKDLPVVSPADSITRSFVWVATAGTHDIRMFADAGNRVIEVDETNNEKKTSFSTLTPDLLVQDIAWFMENPLTSDVVTIIITVKNQGTDIAGDSRLTCSIDETPTVNQDIEPIPAGGSFTLTITPMLKAGSHTVSVAVDTSKQVIELYETNNTKSITFSSVAPDLIIKSISWSPGAAAGDNITITVKVENQGNFKANKSRLDLSIDGSPVQYSEIEEIDMGASVTKDFSWNAVVGSHEITVSADIDGLLQESNEINNTKSRTISLSEPKAPDNEPPIKISPVSSEDKGFIGNFWWAFLLVATLLGVGAFVLALKSFKKD
jgi:uncharacterized repeat protein (TIGR01451 family)